MGTLFELLAILGIASTRVVQIVGLFRKAETAYASSGKVTQWVVKSLLSGTGGSLLYASDLTEGVKKWVKKLIGETVEELSAGEILHAGGRAAAKTFARKIKEKYGIDCPIADFYSDILAEELGDWIADVINQQAKKVTRIDADIFTTVMPFDNVVPELDTYITNMLNSKLKVKLTSIMNKATLFAELKAQLVEKFKDEFNVVLERARVDTVKELRAVAYATGNAGKIEQFKDHKAQIELMMVRILPLLNAAINKRLPLYQNVSIIAERKRTLARQRQRAYRETHREQRVWVNK